MGVDTMKFKGFAVKLAIAGVIIAALVVCLILFYSDIIGIFFYILRLLAPFIIAFILSLAADPLAENSTPLCRPLPNCPPPH